MRIPQSFWVVVRLVLSILLLWLAARNIDWVALTQSQIELRPGWLVLAWLTLIITNALASFRWGWLTRLIGFQGSWMFFLKHYFACGLINQGLPTTIGGDSFRAIAAARQGLQPTQETVADTLHQPIDLKHAPPKLRQSVVAVALDRALGLIGNNVLGAIGLVLAGGMVAAWLVPVGWLVLAAMIGGVSLFAVLMRFDSPSRLLQRLLAKLNMPGAIQGIQGAFGWPTVWFQMALSLLIHLLTLLAFGFCLRAYGVHAPFEALMIGLPALGLLMMLPISISGWGLRETTLSAVLALWNVDPGLTVLASVSYGLVTLVTYLPAAWVLLKRKQPGQKAQGH